MTSYEYRTIEAKAKVMANELIALSGIVSNKDGEWMARGFNYDGRRVSPSTVTRAGLKLVDLAVKVGRAQVPKRYYEKQRMDSTMLKVVLNHYYLKGKSRDV